MRSRGRGGHAHQCRFYGQGQPCRFGNACRFLHGNSAPGQGSNGEGNGDQPARQPGDDRLRQWKRILKQEHFGHPNLISIGNFFRGAAELMDGDVGAAQDVIRCFATDPGLKYVKALVDRHLTVATAADVENLWEDHLKHLFTFITHPTVADSAVLEREVSTIYTYLLGNLGTRFRVIFGVVMRYLQSATSDDAHNKCLNMSLEIVSRTFDCKTDNLVNPYFTELAQAFSALLTADTQTRDSDRQTVQAKKYLEYLQRRLDIGNAIETRQDTKADTVQIDAYVLRRDLPGALSAEGRRHDNDHSDIAEITIMPPWSEIISPRAEYLPTTDASQWHKPGLLGRFDREFRLMREDNIGQLRDAIRDADVKLKSKTGKNLVKSRNAARTCLHQNMAILSIRLDKGGGLIIEAQGHQPEHTKNLSMPRRRDWWEASRRLQDGAVVCVMDDNEAVVFCQVVGETTPGGRGEDKKEAAAAGAEDVHNLWNHERFFFVELRLVEVTEDNIRQALRFWRHPGGQRWVHLVEFPGVLLASFQHTLKAMQTMSLKPEMPFSDILAPTDRSGENIAVLPPAYARGKNFMYDMRCLAKDKGPLYHVVSKPSTPEYISERTGLDHSQAEALLNTLSREVSLIQGPPGTGKSYTGEKIVEVLLANKQKTNIGPILCVCYTNHALDQFLEHMLDHGIKGVIRIGGASKSARMKDRNLRLVVQSADRTKAEKAQVWQLENDLKAITQDSEKALAWYATSTSHKRLQQHLQENYGSWYAKIYGALGADEDSFRTAQAKPDTLFKRWLNATDIFMPPAPRHIIAVLRLESPMLTSREERDRLHAYWLSEMQDSLANLVVDDCLEHDKLRDQRNRIRRDVDLRCLQGADVIGVTCTGLAKNLDLLRKLRAKVLVCEEAGEVLEAHILTALLPSVEHCVLIGDHLQLRPQINNYDLQSTNPRGLQYSLDTSLFERMVKPAHDDDPRLPVSVLETQRRMHPSIAKMIRSTLYPMLKDHPTVHDQPEVKGMAKRLQWFQHEHLENGADVHDPLGTSHSNGFEVEMTLALVQHLLNQGVYKPDDIAVLTPYLGQLRNMRGRMQGVFNVCFGDRDAEELAQMDEDCPLATADTPKVGTARVQVQKSAMSQALRLATVDNFQGEEAKVVVISLVRSNQSGKCGFLSTSNRINVLLSRAKHGCYIIGNASTCMGVPMWRTIISGLQKEGNFGNALELQCPRHPGTPMLVEGPDDFGRISPDGGCDLPCDRRLQCGHMCVNGKCHSTMLHNAMRCLAKCQRAMSDCNHPCPRPCFEVCPKDCQVVLEEDEVTLPCGHVLKSPLCWQKVQPDRVKCRVRVSRTVPGCKHVVQLACHVNVEAVTFMCQASCARNMACNHLCSGKCYECNDREGDIIKTTNHKMCNRKCDRPLATCHHNCQQKCHGSEPCKPCNKRCEVACSHSRCAKTCREACSPCAEPDCASQCPHSKCTMPCAAPCNWIPCSRRCEQMLNCGHRCPSVCGEICPSADMCQICATDDIKSRTIDFIEMQSYADTNLDDDPCVFPTCGHFYTMTSMDGIMDMSAYYIMGDHDTPLYIKKTDMPFSKEEIKRCPDCRGSLRNLARYGRIVRRAILDEATKTFIIWCHDEHLTLMKRLLEEQNALMTVALPKVLCPIVEQPHTGLMASRSRQLAMANDQAGGCRYLGLLRVWKAINTYLNQVGVAEQPFQRVADLVKLASANAGSSDPNSTPMSEAIEMGGHLSALDLMLKCEAAVWSDFQLVRSRGNKLVQVPIKYDFSRNLATCKEIITLATDTKRPEFQVRGNVHFAQFCAFSTTLHPPDEPIHLDKTQFVSAEVVKATGFSHIEAARNILKKEESLSKNKYALMKEIDAAEKSLREGVFYAAVTPEEQLAVVEAMQGEFGGTGHWYTCANGHPFSIGECGMPMERARCPECGAAVGGQNHTAVEGVERARDMDVLVAGVLGL